MTIHRGLSHAQRWLPAAALAAAVAMLPSGCTNDDDDSTAGDPGQTPCLTRNDCPEGWYCHLSYCVDHLPDAGETPADAGGATDAATSDAAAPDAARPDAATADAALPRDAAAPPDAAEPTDAGEPGDAGGTTPGDGGTSRDAAAAADGSRPDAAGPEDAGPRCTGIQVWDPVASTCTEAAICLADEDCQAPRVCVNAACREPPECRSDRDCNGGRCDLSALTCMSAECLTDQDCPNGGACQDSKCFQCWERVTGDAGEVVLQACNGADLCHCQGANCQPPPDTCFPVECLTDDNCTGGQVCVDQICMECRPSGGAAEGPSEHCTGAQVCQWNRCTEPAAGCTGDSDCTGQRVCAGGTCTDPDCHALSQCPDGAFCDAFEPNDDLLAAPSLVPGIYRGTMCAGDAEFFRFDVALGDGVLLRAEPIDPAYGSLEMQMVASDGAYLGRCTADATGGRTCVYETAAATPVLVRMQSIGSPLLPFRLVVEFVPRGLCQPDHAEPNEVADDAFPVQWSSQGAGISYPMTLCSGDSDWFEADLRGTAAQAFQLTVSVDRGPNPVVEVFDDNSTNPVALDTTAEPNYRTLTFRRGSGRYLVHTYNASNQVMSAGWLGFGICEADAQEPDDTAAAATAALMTSPEFRYSLCMADEDWFVADVPDNALNWLRVTTQTIGSAAPVVEIFKEDVGHPALRDATQGLDRTVTLDDRGGRFLVRLSNEDPTRLSNGDVRIDLCKADTREPNNRASLATPIPADGAEHAVSICRDDDDWYAAAVPADEADPAIPDMVLTVTGTGGAVPAVEITDTDGMAVLVHDDTPQQVREIVLSNHTGGFLVHLANLDRVHSGTAVFTLTSRPH